MAEGHHIVCGLGHVGYRVAALLHQLGEPAVVITQQARAAWLQSVRAWGMPALVGDARDPQLLAQAGITRAQAVLALTDQDVVNLEIALDAQEACQTAPLVVRLFDHHLAPPLAAAFPRHRVLDVAALAAPAFVAAGRRDQCAVQQGDDGDLAGELQLLGVNRGQCGYPACNQANDNMLKNSQQHYGTRGGHDRVAVIPGLPRLGSEGHVKRGCPSGGGQERWSAAMG